MAPTAALGVPAPCTLALMPVLKPGLSPGRLARQKVHLCCS